MNRIREFFQQKLFWMWAAGLALIMLPDLYIHGHVRIRNVLVSWGCMLNAIAFGKALAYYTIAKKRR